MRNGVLEPCVFVRLTLVETIGCREEGAQAAFAALAHKVVNEQSPQPTSR